MPEKYLGRIVPDMDVCDNNGDKVGTVAYVYRHELASVGRAEGDSQAPYEGVVEVKTGFLGLGKHLFIPISGIQEVTQGCVFLAKSREELEQVGWDQRPPYLDELH